MANKRVKPKAIPDIYNDKEEGRDFDPKQGEVVSDVPKRFQRIMNQKEYQIKAKELKKKEFKQGGKIEKKKEKLEKLENESLRQFNKRVELTLGHSKSMFKEAVVGKSQKKEKRKQKQILEKQALLELQQQENDRKDFNKLTDKVKFGEVAMAPPTLSAKPKDRAKNRRELINKMQNTGKKTINNQPINRERVGPKIEKSPAEKRILEQERSRVVDMYRRLKKEKLEQQQ